MRADCKALKKNIGGEKYKKTPLLKKKPPPPYRRGLSLIPRLIFGAQTNQNTKLIRRVLLFAEHKHRDQRVLSIQFAGVDCDADFLKVRGQEVCPMGGALHKVLDELVSVLVIEGQVFAGGTVWKSGLIQEFPRPHALRGSVGEVVVREHVFRFHPRGFGEASVGGKGRQAVDRAVLVDELQEILFVQADFQSFRARQRNRRQKKNRRDCEHFERPFSRCERWGWFLRRKNINTPPYPGLGRKTHF